MVVRKTKLERFLRIFGRPIHPVRAVFALIGTALFTIPFVTLFIRIHRKDSYLYLIYPFMFIVAHLVWFRLPFVRKKTRWLLFWLTLGVVISLGIGFLVTLYRDYAKILNQTVPYWLTNRVDVPFTTFLIWIFIPSLVISAVYSGLLIFALRIYRNYRKRKYKESQ